MTTSITAHIKQYRANCAEVKAGAEKDCHARCHIVGRGVEIIALDETGERNDDLGGPDYIGANELTVKYLKTLAAQWQKHYSPNRDGRVLTAIHLAGGYDVYDSFSDYMQAMKGDWMDNEIWDDWAGQDIPLTDLLTD